MMQNCLSSSTAYLAKLRVNRSAIFLPAVTLTVIALQQYTGIPVSQFYLVHITKEGNFPNGDTQFTAGPQTSGSTQKISQKWETETHRGDFLINQVSAQNNSRGKVSDRLISKRHN